MVLPSMSFIDPLSDGEASWPTSLLEASGPDPDPDPDLRESSVFPPPGAVSAMHRVPTEGSSRQVVQVRGLQLGRVVNQKGSGEVEGAGERSSGGVGRGKGNGGVGGGKGVGVGVGGEVGVGKVGRGTREVEVTPFEIVERRYACTVGMEKWERGAMMIWAGGEREVRLKSFSFSLFRRDVTVVYGGDRYHPGSPAPYTKKKIHLIPRDFMGLG